MSLGKGTNVFPYLRRHQSYSGRKFLTLEDEASLFTMDHFPLWYRQASEQPPGSFVFNLRWEEGPGNLHPCALPKSGKRGWENREERTTPGLLPAFPPDTAALELAWCCTQNVGLRVLIPHTAVKLQHGAKERDLTRKPTR